MPWSLKKLERPTPRAGVIYLLAALLVGSLAASRLLDPLERHLVDLRLRVHALHAPIDSRIILVDIDNQSLEALDQQLGKWPWPRSAYVPILQACSTARAVVFDILFAEADLREPHADQQLATAIAAQQRTVLPFFLDEQPPPLPASPHLLRFALKELPPASTSPQPLIYPAVVEPLPDALDAAAAAGFVNFRTDVDGTLRNHLLTAGNGTQLYPSLSLAAWKLITGENVSWSQHQRAITLGTHHLPLDRQWRFGFVPHQNRYETISFSTLFLSDDPQTRWAETLRDRIVFIGSSATGLIGDHQRTSTQVDTPGFLVFAWATDSLLNHRWIGQAHPIANGLIAVIILLLPAVGTARRPIVLTLEALALLVILFFAALATVHFGSILLHTAILAAAILIGHTAHGLIHWLEDRDRRHQLEALELAKQKMTDMLVHDLKNQLAPIAMSLSLIKLQLDDEHSETGQLLDITESSTHRLSVMMNTLLDIRRMEEGEMKTRPTAIGLQSLFADIHTTYLPMLRNGDLRLNQHIDPPELSVMADPELLHRVIDNLLLNAIQYAPDGSTIELVARRDPTGRVQLRVANDGKPIPPEDRTLIFELFKTGQDTRRRAMSGTGIGLAFCKEAIRAQGGSIDMQSPWRDGQGVEFILLL